MPRKKKKPFAMKLFLGLGKLVGWTIIGVFKISWWTAKGIVKGFAWGLKKAQKTPAVNASAQALGNASASYEELKLLQNVRGDFGAFSQRLLKDSLIIAVAGKRGSGKSGLGFRLLENIHASTGRPCFVLGVSQALLPGWVSSIDDLAKVSNNGVVLVDEGAVSFGSRQSMTAKNKALGEFLAIARHNDLTLIFITQNTGMIDKNVLGLCDTVMLKEGSLLQLKMERSAIKDLYATAHAALSQVPAESRISHFYVFDSDFEGLLQAELPSFWSTAVSKSHAR